MSGGVVSRVRCRCAHSLVNPQKVFSAMQKKRFSLSQAPFAEWLRGIAVRHAQGDVALSSIFRLVFDISSRELSTGLIASDLLCSPHNAPTRYILGSSQFPSCEGVPK